MDANITPIYKKGDKHAAENYRPVSLTAVLSKLLEHIVCSHMLKHLNEYKILTSLNHGFRSGFSCETQLAVTMDELFRNHDRGIQTDIAILDFSKAFDKVPHDKLLHKLNAYGIRGNLHAWIKSFLCQRSMRVVVEGEASREVHVESGVPQGTVLGPLLFLCHINDLPEAVTSQVRLFADDCLLYRQINSAEDHHTLQKDLNNLGKWATTWGMKFNAKKCYILRTKSTSSYFYQLDDTILQEVSSNPYLGIQLSSDMKWRIHIDNLCKKASSTLGFLRRNLRHCPKDMRRTAYVSLVRSTMEYGATIWDPHLKTDIDKLEKIQRRAARFITGDYKTRSPGCVTKMLHDLDLPTLEQRRKELRLLFLFKVVEGMLPGVPPEKYLTPARSRRKITATKFYGCVSQSNIVEMQNSRCFKPVTCNTTSYRHSLFPRTVISWNSLPESAVAVRTVEAFKASIHGH